MIENQVKIGLDRFVSLEWANYTLGLYLSSENETENYELLKTYLRQEIPGAESSRKTANQLKRLWLNDDDDKEYLRGLATEILNNRPEISTSIFHFGMAINVFPIFKETCKRLGELSKVKHGVDVKTLIDRVSQTYLGPKSVPRIVSRITQTLEDWGLLESNKTGYQPREMLIEDKGIGTWFILALLFSYNQREVPLVAIDGIPDKLGIQIANLRNLIQETRQLVMQRNSFGEEIVIIRDDVIV